MRLIIASSATILLAACTTAPGDRSSYQEELEAMRQECAARGGVLVAVSNTMSAYPRADYACRMQDVNVDTVR